MNINPNKWSCLPTAFANVIGVPVSYFIEKIGHDGSAMPFLEPHLEYRIGFHTQECVEVLDSLDWSATKIELFPGTMPMIGYPGVPRHVGDPKKRLEHHMASSNGVLLGRIPKGPGEIGHAVSWIDGRFYDPRGEGLVWAVQDLLYKQFEPIEFFKVRPCT